MLSWFRTRSRCLPIRKRIGRRFIPRVELLEDRLAPATHLSFTVQPTSTIAGQTISVVQVSLLDAANKLDPFDNSSVSLAIGANPGGGTLSGTNPVNAVKGVATFNNLSIDKPGVGYTLTAMAGVATFGDFPIDKAGGGSFLLAMAGGGKTLTGINTSLTGATSAFFNITSAAAAQLAFGVQPTNTVAGASINPSVTVRVLDAFGNLVSTDSSIITLFIGTNPGGSTLSGAVTVAAVNGVATFTNLSLDKFGAGYTLTAVDGSLRGAVSSAFNITTVPAGLLIIARDPAPDFVEQPINPASKAHAFIPFSDPNTATSGKALGVNPGGSSSSNIDPIFALRSTDIFGVREFSSSIPPGGASWEEPSSWNLARGVDLPLALANASLEADDGVGLVEMLRQRARAQEVIDLPPVETAVTYTPIDASVPLGTPKIWWPALLTSVMAIPMTTAFVWIGWRFWKRRRQNGLEVAKTNPAFARR